jgi:hypothetical protein
MIGINAQNLEVYLLFFSVNKFLRIFWDSYEFCSIFFIGIEVMYEKC